MKQGSQSSVVIKICLATHMIPYVVMNRQVNGLDGPASSGWVGI